MEESGWTWHGITEIYLNGQYSRIDWIEWSEREGVRENQKVPEFNNCVDGDVTLWEGNSRIPFGTCSIWDQFSHSVMFISMWPHLTAACQASLSITNSWSLLKLMSIELVMPSNHFILYCPLLLLPSIFPSIRVFFQMSQCFTLGGKSLGVSASTSVLSMNTQDWSPLGCTGWISS